jgi:hypothetical protein
MTLTAELNQKAKTILIRELGPVDYPRFIQQHEEETGDYTRDRQQWLVEEDTRILHGKLIPFPSNSTP